MTKVLRCEDFLAGRPYAVHGATAGEVSRHAVKRLAGIHHAKEPTPAIAAAVQRSIRADAVDAGAGKLTGGKRHGDRDRRALLVGVAGLPDHPGCGPMSQFPGMEWPLSSGGLGFAPTAQSLSGSSISNRRIPPGNRCCSFSYSCHTSGSGCFQSCM